MCPAASPIEGATPGAAGVVCGVLKVDDKARDSILTSAALDPFYSVRENPSVCLNLCCGTALPLIERDKLSRQASYTNCDVWQRHLLRTRFAHLADAGLGLEATEPVGHARAAAFDAEAAAAYTPMDSYVTGQAAVDELAGWEPA